MAVSRIRLRHTVTGGQWDCPSDAVGHWRGRGWVPVDEAPDEAAEPSDDEPADSGNESTAAGRRTRKGSK